jgi:hypothetical protein
MSKKTKRLETEWDIAGPVCAQDVKLLLENINITSKT